MNAGALIAVALFAAALLAIFGTLYLGALRSYGRGELDREGIVILRWALLGQVTLYGILANSAFVT